MGMSTSPGGSSAGGKSMGGPNTSGPGGYGNDYNGNPNQGGMPTQFAVGGPGNMYGGGANPGMGVGMDYRNLGGMNDNNPGYQNNGGMNNNNPGYQLDPGMPFGSGIPTLPNTGMGGGKGMGGLGSIIGQIPGLGGGGYLTNDNSFKGPIPGLPPAVGGGQLVGGAYGKPITNQPGQPTPQDFYNQYANTLFGGGPAPLPQPGTPPEATTAELTPQDTYNQYANTLFGSGQNPFANQTTPIQSNIAGGQMVGGPAGQPIFGYGNASTKYAPETLPGGGQLSPEQAQQLQQYGKPMQATHGNSTLQPITNQPGGPKNNRFAPPNAPGVRTAPAAAVSRTNPSSPARVAKPITRTRIR